MASTYSNSYKLELMETGANANTWGNNTNTNLETIDAFSAGFLSKSVAGNANVTLTTADASPTSESSNKVIDLNGTLTANIHVFIPAVENNYVLYNNTSGSFTVTVAATGHAANGTAITQGTYSYVYCDGSANYNVENALGKIGATAVKDLSLTNNMDTNGQNILFDSATGILDDSSNEQLIFQKTATAVNYLEVTNNSTGNSPKLSANGSDTNVGLEIATKGTGLVKFLDAAYSAEATLTDGATISWSAQSEPVAKVTLGGNRAINAATDGGTGQFVSLLVIQDSTGSRTLTWNAAYEFKDDTAPTLTTTGDKGDLFVFRYNGSKWLEVGRNQNLTLS